MNDRTNRIQRIAPPSSELPPFDRLIEIMKILRDPENGCPWDLEQDFKSILRYTIEETYETAQAIYDDDMDELKDELGDLLFQVVFHARLGEELGYFNIDDVCHAICDKMIRRHPHVFGNASRDKDAINQTWEIIKAEEKKNSTLQEDQTSSPLDDIPTAFPSLMRGYKLSKKAASLGFDWSETQDVLNKVKEELHEFEDELNHSGDFQEERCREEFGDLLFSMVNLARHMGIDAEDCLRQGNDKFHRRFNHMLKLIQHDQKNAKELKTLEWEDYWQKTKAQLSFKKQ